MRRGSSNPLRHASVCLAFLGAMLALALGSALPAAADEHEDPDADTPPVAGEWEDGGAKAVDALVLRPMGTLGVVAGTGFFLVSTPFVAPAGGIGESWDVFVTGPVDYTFRRSLGDL